MGDCGSDSMGWDSSASEFKQLTSNVHEMYSPSPKPPRMDILFFHGLNLNDDLSAELHFDTWTTRCVEQVSWPRKWLSQEFPEARVLTVAYDGSLKKAVDRGRVDLHLIAENIVEELLLVKVGQGREVVFVGHSCGGLVVKQVFLNAHERLSNSRLGTQRTGVKDLLSNIRGIFYYSTPHSGLNLPDSMGAFGLMTKLIGCASCYSCLCCTDEADLVKDVKELSNSLSRLNYFFEKLPYEWKEEGVFETLPTQLGNSTLVIVKEASARSSTYTDCIVPLREDHFSITRPISKTDSSYRTLVDFIHRSVTRVQAGTIIRCRPKGIPRSQGGIVQRVFENGKDGSGRKKDGNGVLQCWQSL